MTFCLEGWSNKSYNITYQLQEKNSDKVHIPFKTIFLIDYFLLE